MAKKKDDVDVGEKKPRVSVLERRLQNPYGEPALEVILKDKSLTPHWFNDDIRNGQVYRVRQLGWEFVTPDMVEVTDSLGFHAVSPENRITRGPRGQEVLMYMPTKEYWQIQAAKTKKNLQDMKDYGKVQHTALEAFASEYGGNAAEYVSGQLNTFGSVKTTRERVTIDPEAEVYGGDDPKAY